MITNDDFADIRDRVALAPDEELFVKGNYNLYFMVRGVYTGLAFADVPIISESSVYTQKDYADFIAAAPADVRRLLDALDEARRERDAAVTALREAFDWLDANCNAIPLSGIDVWRTLRKFVNAQESDDDHE